MCEYDCDTSYDEIMVTVEEVTNAIKKLDIHKACGSDGICSEHIKYESMLSVVLVPVIKDKAGKISSKDNYRPICNC